MRKYPKQYWTKFAGLLISLAFFALGATGFAAAETQPMAQLQKYVDGIMEILQSEELRAPDKKDERKQRVLNVVTDMFDFRDMARSSLGQNWNSLTSAEKDTFVGLFTSLLEQRYIGKIDSYDNQKVIYKKERVKDDRAMVYTAILDKDLEIPIIYRLHAKKGKWLVYDMKIENVSLMLNYRRDFDSIIRKENFAGLVERISKQLEASRAAE